MRRAHHGHADRGAQRTTLEASSPEQATLAVDVRA